MKTIQLRVLEGPLQVVSGAELGFTLELKNVTAAPLELTVRHGCLVWDSIATSATTSSFESECGGVCGATSLAPKLTLDAGGVLVKRIVFKAVRTRIVAGNSCEQRVDPLPPDDYQLSINLPPEDPGGARTQPPRFVVPVRVIAAVPSDAGSPSSPP